MTSFDLIHQVMRVKYESLAHPWYIYVSLHMAEKRLVSVMVFPSIALFYVLLQMAETDII